MKIARTLLAVAIGFIGLVIWASYETSTPTSNAASSDSADQNGQSTAEPVAQVAPPAPPIEISAVDLYKEYQANEVAADGKYKGRVLAVTGTVARIGKDVLDDPYVSLAADNEFDTVNAYFGKDKNDRLATIKQGETLTVTCRGKGMTLGSPILDCK